MPATTETLPPAPATDEVINAPEPTVTPTESTTLTDFDLALAQIDVQSKALKELKKMIQDIKSKYNKEVKLLHKSIAKKKPRKVSDKPTGFRKPGSISPELASFFEVPATHQMARIDVTNAINAYVKKNELQNPENRRTFVLNANPAGKKLLGLLKPDEGVEVGYFNLQKWLAPHFIKDTPSASVSVPEASVTPPAPPTETSKPVSSKAPTKRVRNGAVLGKKVTAN